MSDIPFALAGGDPQGAFPELSGARRALRPRRSGTDRRL